MKSPLKIAALILFLAALASAQGEELGRLFFTPAQRTQLNYGKLQESDGESDHTSLTVNGIVQQNGGKRTVWINGVPRSVGKSDERNPASVPVTVPNRPLPLDVKVGQKIKIDSTNDSQH